MAEASSQAYKRLCDNWLDDFLRWTLPRSEAPETFIVWTGLFILASALRRHVKVPKRLLGSWEAAPNLYILFIAKAGRARKTTTALYTEELMEELTHITKAPELITKESLLTTLVKSDDSAMSILAPEFGEFMVKSGPEMYGFLTNMYDGKRRIVGSTLSRGVELVERPCINLLGATTPEWVAANMPADVIGGGFASRVVFVFESTVRRRQLYYDKLDQDALERLRVRLVADLDHISRNINGDFDIAPDAKEFMDAWYRDNADAPPDADSNLSGYFERKPAHIHKIAMLLHLTYSDDLIITIKDFKDAIKLLQEIEVKLPETFQAMGRNPYTLDLKNMAEYIKIKGRVSERELKRKFFNTAARPEDLDGMIQSLIDLGRINMSIDPSKPENQRRYYVIAKATASSNGDNSPLTHPTKISEFDPQSFQQPVQELAQPHSDS
jgi:hypothetical protein